ncbi:MAG: hypothetical protein HY320_12650 [Armatimonadetes bacterium]|nr:hypothetical protein [Armatimonadota bacterium]
MRVRWWLLSGAVATGLVAVAVAAGRDHADRPACPLVSRWTRSFTNVISLSLAPDGSRLAVLSAYGTITCLDRAGQLAWQQDAPEATRVLAGPGGRLVVAYAPRRPLASSVWLFDEDGRRLAEIAAPDVVQSLALAGDGRQVAIGLRNAVLVCQRWGDHFDTLRVPVRGAVAQVHFGPERTLYVLTRQSDSLRRCKLSGKTLWKLDFASESEPAMACTPDGRLLVIASRVEGNGLLIRTLLPSGKVAWETRTPGRDPVLRLATDGSALLVAYEHCLAHEEYTYFERRLGYFSLGEERIAWVKGGPYTVALPAALGADGAWVVTLDVKRALRPPQFRLLGRHGERRWIYASAAPVLIATSSLDGRFVAACRSDGVIELIEVMSAPHPG